MVNPWWLMGVKCPHFRSIYTSGVFSSSPSFPLPTYQVWQLGSPHPNYTLEGHEKGINCIDYFQGGDKPYLISGADDRSLELYYTEFYTERGTPRYPPDLLPPLSLLSLSLLSLSLLSLLPLSLPLPRLVKIWDYQNKACVQTLEGHAQNVTAVSFHSELPILMTGSEDGEATITFSFTSHVSLTFPLPPTSLPFPIRNGPCLACQHLPTGDHSQLWSGAGVVHLPDERLQRRCHWLRRGQCHDQGNEYS